MSIFEEYWAFNVYFNKVLVISGRRLSNMTKTQRKLHNHEKNGVLVQSTYRAEGGEGGNEWCKCTTLLDKYFQNNASFLTALHRDLIRKLRQF